MRKLKVCLFTYNHVNFIEKAIESVLMQRTSIPFELLIVDDCSTDGTFEICKKYQIELPQKISLIERKKNLGMRKSIMGTLLNLKADCIALIEGDDYWIDPLKLDKQYKFLLENESFSMCFHRAIRINEIDPYNNLNLSFFPDISQSRKIQIDEIIKRWIVPTASIMYNNNIIIYPDFSIETYNWDWLISILCAHFGSIYYMNDIMSVYRINEFGNTNNSFFSQINAIPREIELLDKFDHYSQNKYLEIIAKRKEHLKKELNRSNSVIFNIYKKTKRKIKQLLLIFGLRILKI